MTLFAAVFATRFDLSYPDSIRWYFVLFCFLSFIAYSAVCCYMSNFHAIPRQYDQLYCHFIFNRLDAVTSRWNSLFLNWILHVWFPFSSAIGLHFQSLSYDIPLQNATKLIWCLRYAFGSFWYYVTLDCSTSRQYWQRETAGGSSIACSAFVLSWPRTSTQCVLRLHESSG